MLQKLMNSNAACRVMNWLYFRNEAWKTRKMTLEYYTDTDWNGEEVTMARLVGEREARDHWFYGRAISLMYWMGYVPF